MELFKLYVQLGFEHVLPLGFDHVLFIVSLFLYRHDWRGLLTQSLVFTLAHSLSLMLASLGFKFSTMQWVEPIIAFSILYSALESVFPKRFVLNRLLLVGVFGFFHGLGFAGAMKQLLGSDQIVLPLFAFNVGIELAQVAVLLTLWLLVVPTKISEHRYFTYLNKGIAVIIAIVATYWMGERIWEIIK